jgi:L-threonylcarbamoyladenylate synthase
MITLENAKSRLAVGEVIALPTDTVYGLAIDFGNETAVERIYSLKQRNHDLPLIILGHSKEALEEFVVSAIPSIVDFFWPGPLTLILEANPSKVPASILSGQSTVGIRVPNHPQALELLEKTGPLAVTSANLSGKRPALSESEVTAMFGEGFPIVEGGQASLGIASTIIKLNPFEVLRVGSIPKADLEARL